jgi:predicted outer membrane repeat protein
MVASSLIFSGNTATGNGGAIESSGAKISADKVSLSLNTAGGLGGAIAAGDESSVLMKDCSVHSNAASSGGGGVASMGDTSLILNKSLVIDNTAGIDGGGVLGMGNSHLIVMGGHFRSNFAARDGAGIAATESAFLELKGSDAIEFRENRAEQDGGALLIASTREVIFQSPKMLVIGNAAGRGGGICFASQVDLPAD